MEISSEGLHYLENHWIGDVLPAAAQAAAKLAAEGASEEECIIAAEKVLAAARKVTRTMLEVAYN